MRNTENSKNSKRKTSKDSNVEKTEDRKSRIVRFPQEKRLHIDFLEIVSRDVFVCWILCWRRAGYWYIFRCLSFVPPGKYVGVSVFSWSSSQGFVRYVLIVFAVCLSFTFLWNMYISWYTPLEKTFSRSTDRTRERSILEDDLRGRAAIASHSIGNVEELRWNWIHRLDRDDECVQRSVEWREDLHEEQFVGKDEQMHHSDKSIDARGIELGRLNTFRSYICSIWYVRLEGIAGVNCVDHDN